MTFIIHNATYIDLFLDIFTKYDTKGHVEERVPTFYNLSRIGG